MWLHFVILNFLLAFTMANIIDLGDVCKNRRVGDIAPHPFDCQAYFICGNVPTLRYCNTGLLFDSERKVCNWPEHVKCGAIKKDNNNNRKTDSVNTVESETKASKRLVPVFMAVDVKTGQQTDAMNKYDPQHVGCRHFGAYFLPHPQSCRRYYLCAYGHMHEHKCGRGTAWNYKRQECEIDIEAECYSRTIASINIDNLDEFRDHDDKMTTDSTYTTTTSLGQSTICYVVDTTIVTGTGTAGTTWNPTGTTWNPTGTTLSPTSLPTQPGTTLPHTSPTFQSTTGTQTWPPTGTSSETTWYPTGTYHTATATQPPSTTPRSDTATLDLKCPIDGEAYLPNPDDCSKYYICITGLAIATSCPHGLYWDQSAEFCDSARNVQCYQK